MAPIDIRPKGYGGGLPSFVIPPGEKGIERRRRLAEVLAQQGTSTEPVQSWTQGAARVAQSLAGVLGNYQANQMEQQRTSALGQALRSGMTPEQLFATGDEQLMEIAKFKLQQQQQQVEADRQAEMLRLAQAENTREESAAAREAKPKFTPYSQGQPAPYEGAIGVDENNQPVYPKARIPSPYERQTQVEQAKSEADRAERVKAAQVSKAKIQRLKSQFAEEAVDPNTGERQFVKGDDNLFGIIEGDPRYRALGNLTNDFYGYLDKPGTEGRKSNIESAYAGVEMDIARMNFQGQGAVGEREREIVRRRLGGLGNTDAKTAWTTLNDIEADADAIIAGGGVPVGPKPEISITTPRGQPPQHPIQGAPPPQPNVRAGQVPAPPSGGSEFSFGNWEEIPEGRLVRDESDGKMYRKINGQMVPQ